MFMTTDLQSTRNKSAKYEERGAIIRSGDFVEDTNELIKNINNFIGNIDETINENQ